MRLIWPVRSRTRRWRSRWERRASSSSTVGTRTTAHTWRSPRSIANESPQQGERIDPIGLYSARPAIDLDTCWIEDTRVDPDLCQRTRQPETVVTRLIADHDPLLLPPSLAQST